MIQTATAAKRIRLLPSRLAARRQRKKSRTSRNGATTRNTSTALPARVQVGTQASGDRQRKHRQRDEGDRRRQPADIFGKRNEAGEQDRRVAQAEPACRAPSGGRRARPCRAAPQRSAARARPAGRRSGNRRPRRAAPQCRAEQGSPAVAGQRRSWPLLPRRASPWPQPRWKAQDRCAGPALRRIGQPPAIMENARRQARLRIENV